MDLAYRLDRLGGRRKRLAQHLATEQLRKTEILATAAKQVLFEHFQA